MGDNEEDQPYVGQRVTGRNSALLAAGRAVFVDDIELPGCLTLHIIRSPHARARITQLDTAAGLTVPGVKLILTAADMVEQGILVQPSGMFDFLDAQLSARNPLADGHVRYVGEPVAAIVAENVYAARAAARAIAIRYDVRVPILTVDDALAADAPIIEDGWRDNVMFDWKFEQDFTETSFNTAEFTAHGQLTCGRIAATPLEPRGIIADWNRWTETLTVWASTQGPHVLRTMLAGVLGLDDSQVRVIQPHVGGAFGAKIPMFPEDVLAALCSMHTASPVRYIEDRYEYLQAGGHSRDIACEYSVGFDADGRLQALDVVLKANVGAPSTFAGYLMSIVTAGCIPGSYLVPAVRVQLLAAVTNRGPWQAYRGYGKEAATFFLERILDDVARRSGVSRRDVRQRNFVQPEQFPFTLASGWIMDSGDYQATLDLALDLIDADNIEARRTQVAANGRLLGLGFAHELTPEGSARPGSLLGGTDSTTVRVSPRGHVTVLSGVTSPGSGNETGLAQMVADALGADLHDVRVIQGDTQSCPHGNGNYSSRSLTIGGASARLASEDIRYKLEQVAARTLDVPVESLHFSRGRITSSASKSSTTIAAVAGEIYRNPHGAAMEGIDPNLESTRSYKMPNVHHQPSTTGIYNQYPTWSFAAAACLVEVDPATGAVTVVEFALAHDCGVVVNPALAEAQLHGAVMQGIGAALYEEVLYDSAGAVEAPSLREYTLPSVREWAPVTLGHCSTPSPYTHQGMKGVGESGISAPCAALASAIEDALNHHDAVKRPVVLNRAPFTPARVWAAINEACQ